MLYPNRRRPSFLEMNNVDPTIKNHPAYPTWLQQGLLLEDSDGGVHFDHRFRNANNLTGDLAAYYEQTFHHHAFTGRSGTFYKYEGLGSIYWHMVSKLGLAVAENVLAAPKGSAVREQLIKQYHDIKEGIGAHMSPDQYGAFPFDAYSHTPAMAGAQQPGMTGQVKEDIISRLLEQQF